MPTIGAEWPLDVVGDIVRARNPWHNEKQPGCTMFQYVIYDCRGKSVQPFCLNTAIPLPHVQPREPGSTAQFQTCIVWMDFPT